MSLVVVGVGNILFKDEGIGIFAGKYIEENYEFSSGVEVIDGGTLGFKLMTYYQEYDKVIILDTVSIEDEPGSIFNLPVEELMGLGSYRQTAHEVEVVEMLEICSMLEKMAEVCVVGIVPEDIQSVEIGLTDKILEQSKFLVNETIKEIEKSGFEVKKKDEEISMEDVIEEYANPQAMRTH